MHSLLGSLLITILLASQAFADTHTASTCSAADVQAAINAASDGDIVAIPSGTCTWTTTVTLTGKGVTIDGAGDASTVITNGGGKLDITPDASHTITISDIGWSANASAIDHTIDIVGSVSDQSVIIKNCAFNNAYLSSVWEINSVIYINGNYSVISGNTFTSAGKETIQIGGNDIGLWSLPSSAGTASATYVEDNIFTNAYPASVSAHHVVMGFGAARYVVRYNEIHNANIDAHGWCGTADGGTRWVEIYSNNIFFDTGFANTNAMNIRGGTGAIYDNTITINGSLNIGVQLTEYRVDETYCLNIGGNDRCCCNTGGNAGEGWPCYHQVGRGNGQASEPLYIWDNTFSSAPSIGTIYVKNLSGNCDAECGAVQAMADYIQSQSTYTAGHGTAPDYYDDGTELPGYTPYTYPHPLVQSDLGPVRSNGSPASNVSSTASVTLSMNTAAAATCKYGTTADTAYASIASTFGTTGSTTHSNTVAVSEGSNTFYARCTDGTTANTTDFTITFTVLSASAPRLELGVGGGTATIGTGGTITIQ